MGRRKEFDPDTALEKAVHAFWRLGYEHTSLDILMREMGISKQSLYDTFGDKRTIYFRALARYREKTNASLRELFAEEEPVRNGFATLFRAMASENKMQHERGCLLMNTNLSQPVHDAEIRKFLRANQKEVEAIFAAALENAQRRGEVDGGKDPVALARFFVATIQGMRALARLNHNRKELEDIAQMALAALE